MALENDVFPVSFLVQLAGGNRRISAATVAFNRLKPQWPGLSRFHLDAFVALEMEGYSRR
jgi:hypothetical protein